MRRTYHGSCHCGAVRFDAELDLGDGSFRCNCSICRKARSWLAVVRPDGFRLTAGEAMLADYRFGPRRLHHVFCRTCGVRPFGWGAAADVGGRFYAINLGCLDDVDPAELAAVQVTYLDGRNDDFASPPAETRHL